MYNLLIKKYYLKKIFILCLPKTKTINISCFFLCKYLIKNTPYINIFVFLKEISKIFSIILYLKKKNFFFICSNFIYIYNFVKIHKLNITLIKNIFFFQQKKSILNYSSVFLYNLKYDQKFLVQLKDKKIITTSFINFQNQAKITDFTLLLETRFFSSIFLFHFILKKFISNAKK